MLPFTTYDAKKSRFGRGSRRRKWKRFILILALGVGFVLLVGAWSIPSVKSKTKEVTSEGKSGYVPDGSKPAVRKSGGSRFREQLGRNVENKTPDVRIPAREEDPAEIPKDPVVIQLEKDQIVKEKPNEEEESPPDPLPPPEKEEMESVREKPSSTEEQVPLSEEKEENERMEEEKVPIPVVEEPSEARSQNDGEEEVGPVVDEEEMVWEKRRESVREGMLHAFYGYRKFAWGHDEISPQSNGTNDSWGKMGVTIVDGLDTMMLMGLDKEVALVREHIVGLDFDRDYDASFFETTIRYLGGLLAAFSLSNDVLYLEKARQLADRLVPAFNTSTGVPFATVNLKTGRGFGPHYNGGASILSEAGSVQMEFAYLSHVTGDPSYHAAASKAIGHLLSIAPEDGLFPVYVHPQMGKFTNSLVTLGALGDSFYEILLKSWLLTGKKETFLREMYDQSVESIHEQLVKTNVDGMLFIGERHSQNFVAKMDHLVCFAPGMLALGAQGKRAEKDVQVAKGVLETCWETYESNPSGLGPEIVRFFMTEAERTSQNSRVPAGKGFYNDASHYLLRPETLESMFVLWRITGDGIWRERGWKIFQALERVCRTPSAYSGVKDVGKPVDENWRGSVEWNNSMQSFFLSETLKYAWLLFSPNDVLPLDQVVFTTEGHPFPIFS